MEEKKQSSELDDDYLEEEEDTQKDKYLTFRISNEDYAIEIRHVTEIIGIQRITEVPDTPHYVRGIINLRGKVIPVIDVRTRFNLPDKEYGDRTCIIVVNLNDSATGLIVDEVSEVLSIPEKSIDPPPKTNKGAKSRYINGIGKISDQVKILLNIDHILNDSEVEKPIG
ncbi:MAG: purine-binding chemotaxis protein CheW [Candidatus Delongbacteria bacterium]|nr:purine-binding chemotaxis protein CheW [Candidatus Delongbacteria bacterium]